MLTSENEGRGTEGVCYVATFRPLPVDFYRVVNRERPLNPDGNVSYFTSARNNETRLTNVNNRRATLAAIDALDTIAFERPALDFPRVERPAKVPLTRPAAAIVARGTIACFRP